MIIDSHLYCFEPLDNARGYSSSAEHLGWAQSGHASHHQPAIRISDGAHGPSEILDPAGTFRSDGLPDVGFELDKKRGRVVWNYEGTDYTKYFMPPNQHNCESTPYSLDCEMHYAGVDVALMHTDPMLVRDSSFLGEIVEEFPQRFCAMAPVDEWRLLSEMDAVIAETVRAIEKHRLHAIKFIPPLCYLISNDPWDDGPYRPFWEAVRDLGVPVFFTLGTCPEEFGRNAHSKQEQRHGYMEEQRILVRWMERYPELTCSLTHGFPWRAFLNDEGRFELPDELWEPFWGENCNLEVCFPVRIGDLFDYPYREVWAVLEELIQHVGPAHLLWGTDMPFQNRFCTYRQSRKWIEVDFAKAVGLEKRDLDMIMGGTCARLLGIS